MKGTTCLLRKAWGAKGMNVNAPVPAKQSSNRHLDLGSVTSAGTDSLTDSNQAGARDAIIGIMSADVHEQRQLTV